MKKIKISVLPAIIVIFIIFFIIGKGIATKNSKEPIKKDIEENLPMSIVSPAASEAEKVPKIHRNDEEKQPLTEYNNIETESAPPERMLFPCGKKVLKEYIQNATYSKTMDDWRSHMGIDYEAEIGDTVVSVWDGTVQKVYKDVLWGHCIEIVHQGDIISIYKNLDKDINVKQGDKVTGGQAIAKIGNTAFVEMREKPHLHFELWTGGAPINPESYIY